VKCWLLRSGPVHAQDGSTATRDEFAFFGKRRIEMKWMKRLLFLSFFVVYPVAAAPTPGACGMQVTGDLNLNFEVPQTIPGISTPGVAA
jgi:hypothetical protein